jgi:hypothetical protein
MLVKYYANKKAWTTMIIFTEFVRALDAPMDVQSRKFCCLWTVVPLICKVHHLE